MASHHNERMLAEGRKPSSDRSKGMRHRTACAVPLMGLYLSTIALCLSQLQSQSIAEQTSTDPIDFASLQTTIDKLLPKLKPTVVCIESGGGSGSGVIVSADGLVLTAAHVIDKSHDLTIVYPDGRRFKGKSLGTYGPADAGMAQILEGAPHPFVNVANGRDIKVGDTVIALGHPGGFDEQRGPPLRIGHILSAREHFTETDTALIGGDSGGPSFDLNGDVIGIHSHISDQLHVNNDGHISSFHRAWESMQAGKHDAVHYSKSLGDKEERERQDQVAENKKPVDETPETTKSSTMRSLAEQSKANGGSLRLSRDELRKLRQGLALRTESLAPANGTRFMDDWAKQWVAQFQPMTAAFRQSVHKLIVADRVVALGTAVHADGLLITKASEVKGKVVSVEVGPKEYRPVEIQAISEELDLAILKVPGVAFKALDLSLASKRLKATNEMGTLCAAVGAVEAPVGFGIVCVAQRPLNGKSGAYLGVTIAPDNDGIRIAEIKPNSPAIRAGLKNTDRIKGIDGQAIQTNDELNACVATHVPGDSLRIDVERGDTQLTLLVKLGDGASLAPMPGAREQAIDSESTQMSKRRWFFAKGIQHDCAISARDCGGPLIDLDGHLLGINIARAGRIQSYAIPIKDVVDFLRTNGAGMLDGGSQ